ncbi:MAG: Protease IV [uncultured Rubrobacteraceae bacterium]|uniref:Protease IV n=1 Tax=uncultured Rubrobacteraceae bacterium TaxID=349277 RepID=A0A6J4QCJ6_9ACTN|nr:MAG: Protease IV [uncultured Rubrobacteraceae bacterium]
MSLLVNAFVNLIRLLGNVRRALRRPPDFVWLSVSGTLPEFEPSRRGVLRRRLAPRTLAPSLQSIRSRLQRILVNGRVQGVILRVEDLDAGWAVLEELREELLEFRSKGKKIVAYLQDPDTRSYYLASAADEVYAAPLSTLNVTGLRARVNFLKDALASVGLTTEVIAVSPYKSAADTISRSDFSRESREQVERLLDARFDEVVEAISAGRGILPGEVRDLIDHAPHPANEAVRNGLLDGALYEDELPGRLAAGVDSEKPVKLAEWGTASKALRVQYRSRRARRVVGVVSIEGAIRRGRSRKLPVPLPLLGREQAGSDSVVAALRVAEKSRRVAAVLLHVDSPGGDALASDLIWREVQRIRSRKPVVVLMGNAAASGGYYVAAPANYIVARKNTTTGSIGVILTRPVAAGLFDKLKVHPVSIERGAHSNLLDPRRPPTPDELAVLRTQLNTFYDGFKDRVSSGRNLQPGALEEIAGGRVWTGAEALALGLVDETGGLRTALHKARELANISDGPEVLVRIQPPGGTRPTPGDPVGEAVDAMSGAFSDLMKAPRVWALAPYEVSDG